MLIVEIKVVPNSGTNKWVRDKTGRLKCFLKNLPERGRANQELIKLIADALRLPQSDIEIISGLTDRTKRVRINVLYDLPTFLSKVGIVIQQNLF
jgi:uncharacterized protein (TIGR00251 family)